MAVLIGLMIGAILGLTGAGGSIFAVPLIILFLGLSTSNAMGIALGAVAVAALLGTISQRKMVLWVPAVLLGGSGLMTAPLGRYLAVQMPEAILTMGFSLITTVIAIKMIRDSLKKPDESRHVRANTSMNSLESEVVLCKLNPSGRFELKPRCISGLIIGGLLVGLTSGLFGVGGGFLIVPFLTQISGISINRAIASSLAIITAISTIGFISHLYIEGIENYETAGTIIVCAIAGMLISQRIAKYLSGPILQQVFAGSMLLIGATLIAKALW